MLMGEFGKEVVMKEFGAKKMVVYLIRLSALSVVIKSQDNCLGLHVVATDFSNVQLLNKRYTTNLYNFSICRWSFLEIQHIDTSTTNKMRLPKKV
uniref:Uncharacterized protein n=1 Tax=Lactuca sativa TaxID=4236 RepID=A0A9R1W8P8_LACSA|nr:hypothetical protein LSAT_V11C200051210 [Lactuca sativa]